jgi:hypothetical protein
VESYAAVESALAGQFQAEYDKQKSSQGVLPILKISVSNSTSTPGDLRYEIKNSDWRQSGTFNTVI